MFSLSWFTGGNAASRRKDEAKKSIIQLREQVELMHKKEKLLEVQIQAQTDIARKNANSNKSAALAALKRRKMHEQTLTNLTNHIMTLEQQIHSIENAHLNAETFRIMKQAGDAMKNIHYNMPLEKVEDVMENVREQNALQQEIGAAITGGGLGTDMVDEAELDEELERMQQEALDKTMLKAPAVPVSARTPAVAAPPKKTVEDEEEDLRKMREEMMIAS